MVIVSKELGSTIVRPKQINLIVSKVCKVFKSVKDHGGSCIIKNLKTFLCYALECFILDKGFLLGLYLSHQN